MSLERLTRYEIANAPDKPERVKESILRFSRVLSS